MNKAAEYLKNTSRSILDIGRLLGYENPSNFSRTFKEVYGMLPKEYRNKNV
jgi:AraC-like DNA-binding protein